MFAQLKLQGIESDDARDGARYQARGHGRFTSENAAPVACDVINISYSGAAVKTYGSLRVGEKYKLEIVGLGAFPCRVVRNFDGANFGVRFDISLEGKLRLRKHLEQMFNSGIDPDPAAAVGDTSSAPQKTSPAQGAVAANTRIGTVIVAPDALAQTEEASQLATRYGANVLIVEPTALRMPAGRRVERVLVTDAGTEAARNWIVAQAGPGTLIITGNVSLSFDCLKAGAVVLDSSGQEFLSDGARGPRAGETSTNGLESALQRALTRA